MSEVLKGTTSPKQQHMCYIESTKNPRKPAVTRKLCTCALQPRAEGDCLGKTHDSEPSPKRDPETECAEPRSKTFLEIHHESQRLNPAFLQAQTKLCYFVNILVFILTLFPRNVSAIISYN